MSDIEVKRLLHIAEKADQDSLKPDEYMRRTIRKAIQYGSPFVDPNDKYVVFGVDGYDGSIFPSGSFKGLRKAQKTARQKSKEERQYSDGEEIKTTFHVFTIDGTHVPLRDKDARETGIFSRARNIIHRPGIFGR